MTPTQPSFYFDLIPAESRELLRRVSGQAEASGMPLYLAGGIVRDLLLGKPVKDIDVVVEGDAIKLARFLSQQYGGRVTAHVMFGTATWHLPAALTSQGGIQDSLDVATARTERYERPGALPTVEPATIREDLHRRDFTINAMALPLDTGVPGQLLDPFGGQADLGRRLVQILHPASFIDDPTRMFRAIRYARRYAFEFAAETRELFNGEALQVLTILSGERLRHELDLILDEPEAASMLEDASRLGLLTALHPSIPSLPPGFGKLLASPAEAKLGVEVDRRSLGYALWWMELPGTVLAALRDRLALDAGLAKILFAASELLPELPRLLGAQPSQWTARLDKLPLAAVYAVCLRTREPALRSYLEKWRHMVSNIKGDELKQRGLTPGPVFKEILERLRAAWLDGEVTTRGQELGLLEKLLKERGAA